jgi:predicted DNA-binding transcriptional regulator YafY
MELLKFWYINSRGDLEQREVVPQQWFFGIRKPYYTEPQWLLSGYDIKRQAFRTFALCKMQGTLFTERSLLNDHASFWERVLIELPLLYSSISGRKNFRILTEAIKRIIRDYKKQVKAPYQKKLDEEWVED